VTVRVWHLDFGDKSLRVDGIRSALEGARSELEARGIRTCVVGPNGDASLGDFIHALARGDAPEVVHLHSLYRPRQDAAAVTALLSGRPYVVSPHSALAAPGLARRAAGKRTWIGLVGRRLLEEAAAVCCLSPQEESEVGAVAPRARTVVIPNMLPADVFDRPGWSIDAAQSNRLVSLARFDVRQKGLDVLADIASVLPLRITIAVHGEQDKNEPRATDRLRMAAPPNFGLHPAVFGSAKFDLLRSATMYVAPSRWEGLSVSLLEALAVGVPIAVSSYVARTLPVAEMGLGLVLADDPRAAAAQLVAALDDRDRLVTWSAAGREWVRRECSPAVVAGRLSDLYRDVTGDDESEYRAPRAARVSDRPSRRLRIVMTTARYLPSVGGTEIHTSNVARRLVERGHEVTVVAADGDRAVTREDLDGVAVLRVPGWPRGRDYHVAPAIRHLIAGGDWDVVHCQGYHTAVAPLAMRAAESAGLPLVLTFHSGGTSSLIRRAWRPLQHQFLRPMVSRADRLVAVSEFEAAHLAREFRLPRDRFTTIPSASALPASSAQRTAPPGTLVCSIGRLERYKGHHRAIAALPYLRESTPDARLLIVGTGPYEARLRQLARHHAVSDYIEFTSVPAGDRGALSDLLALASLVVLLSEYESQGIAAHEALAVGVPVLVSDTTALGELASTAGVTTIAPDVRPAVLAAAMLRALDTTPAEAPPTVGLWDDVVDTVEALYRSLLAERAR
jgi:glycosyltransferase involved in cell wall biosynthesis